MFQGVPRRASAVVMLLLALITGSPAWGQVAADTVSDSEQLLAAHRKMIVVLADAPGGSFNAETTATRVAMHLSDEARRIGDRLAQRLTQEIRDWRPEDGQAPTHTLAFLRSTKYDDGTALHDGDRVAFREVLNKVDVVLAARPSNPAVRVLQSNVAVDRRTLDELGKTYDAGLGDLRARMRTGTVQRPRENWNAYVETLRSRYRAEDIVREYAPRVGR